jgi:hypothetical protein
MRHPAAVAADRTALLRATLATWLGRAEGRAPDPSRVEALLDGWPDALPEVTEPLPARLYAHAAARNAGVDPGPGALACALAQALADRATADVAREAARAGHAEAFAALRPWLHRALPEADAVAIAARLGGLPPAALATALRRLRGRYRQRIEAGLALCSASSHGRAELRRQLHAALVDLEARR